MGTHRWAVQPGPGRAVWLVATLALLTAPLPAEEPPSEAASSFPDEPFVVERLATTFRFDDDGTGVVRREMRYRVQSESGVKQLGQLFHFYVKGRSRVEVESLRIIAPDGAVSEGGSELVRDLPAPVTTLFPSYSDLRVLHVAPAPLRPGDTLEYRLVEHLEEPPAPSQFWLQHGFEKRTIVLEEVVTSSIFRSR